MNTEPAERTAYLLGLLVLLVIIMSTFGVPSAAGTPAVFVFMILSWRLGVLFRNSTYS